jgi:hypothetical protein
VPLVRAAVQVKKENSMTWSRVTRCFWEKTPKM